MSSNGYSTADDRNTRLGSSTPFRTARPRLGELLCSRGFITAEQLQTAVDLQKKHRPHRQIGQILIEQGLISEEQLLRTLADSVGTPFRTLTADMVHSTIHDCLPHEFLNEHNLLPLSLTDEVLEIAVESFTDVMLREEIERRIRRRVIFIAATGTNIREIRESINLSDDRRRAKPSERVEDGFDHILNEIDEDLKIVEEEDAEFDERLVAEAAESPTVRLVNHVIREGVELRASDIHIEPDDDCFRVRYRIDGDLVEGIRPPSRLLPAVVSRIKVLSGLDISERRIPQDGGVSLTFGERPIDLRVSTMTAKYGEKVVIRLIDRDAAIQTLDAIGMHADMLQQVRRLMKEPNGILLVTGPTGSGKTTTLYAVLRDLISVKDNISTVEDPVERRLLGTNQFQVHPNAGFTFARALRSLLRQDPDVIMIGEIRDTETACLATEAALTGHLVFSTLHTNDAVTAVPRLVNMGVEPYLVAASLRGVVAQRLVRRVCSHCREARTPEDSEKAALAQLCGQNPLPESIYAGRGCARCHDNGTIGRIGVFELLELNEDLLSGIARDVGIQSVREIAKEQDYVTLREDGMNKVREGLITLGGLLEIISRTDDVPSSARRVGRAA